VDLSSATSLLSQGAVLASAGDGGWPDWDGGWWIARLAFLTFWILLVFFLVRWLVFGRWGRRGGGPNGIERARAILAERYARGEIDANEYQERLERLR
jgi:putative membrane protein